MNDKPSNTAASSHLFTLRVWVEAAHDGDTQVRVQAKHVLSGDTRTFREWPHVIAFITARIHNSESDPPAKVDLY